MANYSIAASQLSEGSTVLIRGKLAFARLTRLIEGQDLVASDQRKAQNGMNPVGKPHTTATITHAEVVFADPSNPTTEEQFVAERRYNSKKNPDTGLNYSIDSKGTNLPIIAVPAENGNFDQDTSGRELAQGLDVTLVLRVYKPKNFSNRGLALDQVLVNEAPRYFNTGGPSPEALAARGVVFNSPPQAVAASDASPVGESQDVSVGTDVEDGLSFPSPQPQSPVQTEQPAAAPAQVQAPAPPAQPAEQGQNAAPASEPVAQAGEETMEQKLARLKALEAENAALKQGGSAVGGDDQGPWNGPGITHPV